MELCLTFCNNLYGKRTQKRTDMLYAYVITESGGLYTDSKHKTTNLLNSNLASPRD